MSIGKDAIKQVQTLYSDFENSEDFDKIKFWGLLTFMLHNADLALQLAEKYNVDAVLDSMESLVLTQSLFKDGVMLYCKCFASAQGKRVRLDINEIAKNYSEPEQHKIKELHEEIMEIRNGYIAHNSNNDFEAPLISHKNLENKIELLVTVTMLTPTEKFKAYRLQIALVSQYVIKKTNLILDKIQIEKGVLIDFKQ